MSMKHEPRLSLVKPPVKSYPRLSIVKLHTRAPFVSVPDVEDLHRLVAESAEHFTRTLGDGELSDTQKSALVAAFKNGAWETLKALVDRRASE